MVNQIFDQFTYSEEGQIFAHTWSEYQVTIEKNHA